MKIFFKNIDNEKSAYWLGFIMADGCINEVINKKTKKLKSMNLSISLSTKDNHHLEKFLNDIESDCIVRDEVLHSKGKNIIIVGFKFITLIFVEI